MLGKSVGAIQNLDNNRRRWNILPDGSYQFSFKFHIPKDRLPSSIKCHQLFVCYSLAACVNLNNHPYYTYKPITLQHEIDVSETGLIVSP